MGGTPGMPELGEYVPTLPMNGVRDSVPSRNLLVRIQAGGTEPSPSRDRNRSPFRNHEPTFGGPLRIVLEHQVTRNAPRLNGPRACKRSHHHAVLQLHGSDLNWGEQFYLPLTFSWISTLSDSFYLRVKRPTGCSIRSVLCRSSTLQ